MRPVKALLPSLLGNCSAAGWWRTHGAEPRRPRRGATGSTPDRRSAACRRPPLRTGEAPVRRRGLAAPALPG